LFGYMTHVNFVGRIVVFVRGEGGALRIGIMEDLIDSTLAVLISSTVSVDTSEKTFEI
jgi:hypothetical protein